MSSLKWPLLAVTVLLAVAAPAGAAGVASPLSSYVKTMEGWNDIYLTRAAATGATAACGVSDEGPRAGVGASGG